MKTNKNQSLISVLCFAVLSFGLVSSVNATLEKRLGGLAYYDTELNISWAVTRAHVNGGATWSGSRAWASNLTVGGVGGWRLPSADVNGDQQSTSRAEGICFTCADNELGYLFHQEGITQNTPGVFSDILPSPQAPFLEIVWTDTEFLFQPSQAFHFVFDGNIDVFPKDVLLAAWAVHDGDVGASSVSEPGTIALLGLGLTGLLALGRRQRRR